MSVLSALKRQTDEPNADANNPWSSAIGFLALADDELKVNETAAERFTRVRQTVRERSLSRVRSGTIMVAPNLKLNRSESVAVSANNSSNSQLSQKVLDKFEQLSERAKDLKRSLSRKLTIAK